MKQKLSGLIAFLVLASILGSAGFAADEMKATGKATTVQGEVLDMACYLGHGASGAKHKECAAMCIQGGAPMGLLTKDGKVYLLVENHEKKDAYASLKNMAAEQVKVTGTEHTRGGIRGFTVDSAEKAM